MNVKWQPGHLAPGTEKRSSRTHGLRALYTMLADDFSGGMATKLTVEARRRNPAGIAVEQTARRACEKSRTQLRYAALS